MHLFFTLFAVNFAHVGLKAFQQKNVIANQYLAIIPVSYCMAACEVYIVYSVAKVGFSLPAVLAIGTGAGMGAITAMLAHNRLFRVKSGKHPIDLKD